MIDRRRFLGLFAGGTTTLAGCSDSSVDEGNADADVIAGPEGRLVFDPADITITTGDSVVWFFDSPGHNVSCRPDDSPEVSLPPDAAPFSTYGPDEVPRYTVARGETYEHTFDVPGTYVYVCIPHVAAGMIGRVHVEG